MAVDGWDEAIAQMRARGIAFEPGLSNAEVIAAKSRFEFRFPPDLRDYLALEFGMTEDDKEERIVPKGTRPIAFWNTDRFQDVRWSGNGGCVFDNSRGQLP